MVSEELEQSTQFKKQEKKEFVIIAIRPEDAGTKAGVSHYFPVFNPKRQMVETIELKTGRKYEFCVKHNKLSRDVYNLLAETEIWQEFVEETRSVGFLKPRSTASSRAPAKSSKSQTQRTKKSNSKLNDRNDGNSAPSSVRKVEEEVVPE